MTPHPTLGRLNSEWAELARLPVPAGWTAEPALAGLTDRAGVLAAIRADPDAVLAALLRREEPTAWRVVLQAMLGRAVRDAARDREHDLDDYLGELWLGIAGYPLHRRPARIAANLALDAAKRVRARPRAIPVDPARLALVRARPAEPARSAALLLARARRAALLDAPSHVALRLVYADGLSGDRAAVLLGVTPAALRQRCHRAVRRLAAHAEVLGEGVSYPQALSTVGITTAM